MVVRPQRRERPRCDCGKDIKAADLGAGMCTRCGQRIEAAATEKQYRWHDDD